MMLTDTVTNGHRLSAGLAGQAGPAGPPPIDDFGGFARYCPDLLVMLDAGGIIRAASPAWGEMLARAPADLAGRAFIELLHPEDRARAAVDLAWVRERGSHHFVTRCRHARGHHQSIAWSAGSRDGTVWCIGREQGRATAGADSAAAAPTRMHRLLAMGRLSGGIAHDFNNLLQALRNALELIRRSAGDERSVHSWAESALRVVDRGARLTGQLLATSGAQRLASRPVMVAPLLHGMKEMLQRTLPPQVKVLMELLPDAGSALTDPVQLESAVLNLALNACDAMPDGGQLTIGCTHHPIADDAELATGTYIGIQISDTGPGMSQAVRERAFEHFFTTKSEGKGSGLGLSQVYSFSRQCGGTTRILASGPHGTTVSLLLPALADAAPAPAERTSPPHEDAVVLVVDDDDDVRRLLCDSLRVLGYRAVPVADGLSALAALDRHAASALVIDVAMPGMSGVEVARQARRAWPGVGIVLVSGEHQPQLTAEYGAHVLLKPFDLATLSAAVDLAAARG